MSTRDSKELSKSYKRWVYAAYSAFICFETTTVISGTRSGDATHFLKVNELVLCVHRQSQPCMRRIYRFVLPYMHWFLPICVHYYLFSVVRTSLVCSSLAVQQDNRVCPMRVSASVVFGSIDDASVPHSARLPNLWSMFVSPVLVLTGTHSFLLVRIHFHPHSLSFHQCTLVLTCMHFLVRVCTHSFAFIFAHSIYVRWKPAVGVR